MVFGLLLFGGGPAATRAWGQAPVETRAREPAAAGLARDLIGEPEGERLAGATLHRVTEEVAALLRCPVCQGLSVADSPTTSALAMREETGDLLASGYTEDQVMEYFERSYGEFIRLSPKPEGFNLVVWILPVVGLLAGAMVIGGRMRRRVGLAAGSAEPPDGKTEKTGKPEPAETTESAEKPATVAAAGGEIPEELAAYAERVRREVDE